MYIEEKPEKEDINFIYRQPNRSPNRKKTRLFFLALILVLLIGGCVTRNIIGEYAPEDPSAYDPVTLEPRKPEGFFKKIKHIVFKKEKELAGEKDDRINLLLLGMGGVGHDGPFLTDTIIIASIKPSTGQVAMISIPRDLGVKIPDYGWRKINNASAFGEAQKKNWGGAFATEVIEETFDININYYVRVDFKAFSEVVDEVDGVTVSIDRSFTDHMYPAPNHEYQTIEFIKGTKLMNGETALQYARSRHGNNGEGSDFARAKRQQKVILALKEKIMSFGTLSNPVKIYNIVNALEKHITTNLEFSDMMTLLRMAKNLDTNNIISFVLDNSLNNYLQNGYSPNGAFILEPKSGNFKEINQLIDNIFEEVPTARDNTPAQIKPSFTPANIEIQNGTWIAGMAARMKKRLQDKNFTITSIGNAEEKPIGLSGIYKISDKEMFDTTQALQEELHIPIKESLPEDITATSTTDILVILGEDINE